MSERMSPERRFSLYSRIAEIAREEGANSLADTAIELATEAAKESPEIQKEVSNFLERIKNA
jgi:hypothetical protein